VTVFQFSDPAEEEEEVQHMLERLTTAAKAQGLELRQARRGFLLARPGSVRHLLDLDGVVAVLGTMGAGLSPPSTQAERSSAMGDR
jgi:hypothetical protein